VGERFSVFSALIMAKTKKTRELSRVKPLKKLTRGKRKRAGRNNQGRITMRHQGGGHKRLLREINFGQIKKDVAGKVESIEYDPNRTAFIARISYEDGDRRYILAPTGLAPGDKIIDSDTAPIENGNRTVLKRIPVGTNVYNVALAPERKGQLARSAGSYLQVLANEDGYTQLKMSSGEIRKTQWNSSASIGQVSNPGHSLRVLKKAGRSRWLGIRPTVRGSAMNPRDHPYGGGEGRAKRGTKRPKTKWGKVTGGHKTRKKKKWSNKLIIKRRK